MKLIAENETGNISLVKEELDESGSKTLFIEGVFAQAEKMNRNKRIYPKNVLEKAIGRYVNDYVSQNKAMGELNHANAVAVNPERACILIKKLEWNGNDVIGKAKVLSTPQGEIVRSLIKDGVLLGVSTRGLGTLSEKSGESVVEDDYTISAIDVVSNPSGIDCWVNGVLENTEFYYENGVLMESTIDEYMKNKRNGDFKTILEDFKSFISSIRI